MEKLKVLLTGATGYIAGQLLPEFRERYDLRLLDVRQDNREGQPVDGVIVADLLGDATDRLAPHFQDVEAVVHLGYARPQGEGLQAQYDGERRNVDMMQRVYQLALDSGVRRVVAGSTNQAAKWYEQPYYAGLKDRVSPYEYPRPDNLYGWAKAAYEALGFVYACGTLGRKLEVIHLRIVAPRDIGADQPLPKYLRDIAGYISERDLRQLFRKALETPNIEDEYGVPFHIFYGVSNNARKFWSITNARRVLDYRPEDDSEVRFATDIQRKIKESHETRPKK
ncbi:MAG: NAD(P)-dependent oxidoreductase [Chloroflexota bacterium]|nr:NAD(P)-dependent oxidoreductase [Chloroflexota bacterium]